MLSVLSVLSVFLTKLFANKINVLAVFAFCQVLKDPEARKYISGIAVHWYGDGAPLAALDATHSLYPHFFLQYTEACNGAGVSPHVALGDWGRAEKYATDIIDVSTVGPALTNCIQGSQGSFRSFSVLGN